MSAGASPSRTERVQAEFTQAIELMQAGRTRADDHGVVCLGLHEMCDRERLTSFPL